MAEQGIARSYGVAMAVAVVGLTLGGCASVGWEDLNPTQLLSSPSSSSGARDGGFTVFRGAASGPQLAAAMPSDLVAADGQCQGGSAEPSGVPRGIVLTITECELVAAAGVPEQVNIGADENGDRRTVLTYTKGENSGIYTFVSGRLKIIERAPEPAKPEPRRRAPKRQRA